MVKKKQATTFDMASLKVGTVAYDLKHALTSGVRAIYIAPPPLRGGALETPPQGDPIWESLGAVPTGCYCIGYVRSGYQESDLPYLTYSPGSGWGLSEVLTAAQYGKLWTSDLAQVSEIIQRMRENKIRSLELQISKLRGQEGDVKWSTHGGIRPSSKEG